MDPLIAAYLEKFFVRVEVLREYYKRKSYSDVIREGQEALELCLKAVLRSLGVEPSFSHDPGKELAEVETKLPALLKPLSSQMISWSKRLRKEREFAFYGAADFVPTQEYSKADALEVIEFLETLSKVCSKQYK